MISQIMCCLISLAYYQTNDTMQAMLKTSNPDKDQQISELQDEVQKLSCEYVQ